MATVHYKTFALTISLMSVMLFSGTEAGVFSSAINANATSQFSVVSDLAYKMNVSTWNSVTMSDMGQLSKAQIQQILTAGGQSIPKRIQLEMKRLSFTNMTNEDIRNALGDAQVTPGMLQQLRLALPPAESLNADNVTFYGPNILKLGNWYTLRITNISALQAVYQMASQKCSSTNDPTEKENCKSFLNHLIFKIYGQPETWMADTVKRMDLTTLSANTISRISASAIVAEKDAFTQILGGSNDVLLRRILVKKILTGSNFYNIQSNTAAAINVLNGLGSLRVNVMPEDITDSTLQQNPEVRSILAQNVQAMAKTGTLTPKSVASLQNTLKIGGNITAAQLSTLGINVVGFAFPSAIRTAGQNRIFHASDVPQIVSGLPNGVGKASKLRALADIVSSSLDPNYPSVSQYSIEIIDNLLPSIISKISEGDAKVVLSGDGSKEIDENTRRTLLNKVNSGYASLNAQTRVLLLNSKIREMQSYDRLQVAAGLPPASTVAMIAAEAAFSQSSQIGVSTLTQAPTAAQFMGAKEAMKVNLTNIMDVLLQMKDSNPSMAACSVLKNKYYNYTRDYLDSTSEENTVKQMTVTDIESMPVCVFASFGANAINLLSNNAKVSLLTRLGLVENPDWSIPRPFIVKVIRNGLTAMRTGTGLLSGDVEVIGNALNDVPGDLLSKASTDVYFDVITKLNSVIIKRQMLPCLDSSQRNAIGNMIKNIKGDPSTWDDVKDVACLLYCVSVDDLKKISTAVMAVSSCPLGGVIPILNETLMELCKSSLGMIEFNSMMSAHANLRDFQIQAALNTVVATSGSRKKRQSSSDTSTICAKASIGGANAFSDSDLQNFPCATVMSCLSDFGFMDMAQSKATILATTLKNCYNLASLNASVLLSMSYILKGFSSSDYSSLPTFTYGSSYDNVVDFLGSVTVFSPVQMQQLASKIKYEWRTPYSMSSQDLRAANHLLCGFSSSDISSLSPDAVHGAMGTISCMDDCPLNPVIYAFADFAKIIYGPNVTNWTKADVAELCVFIDGLAPEDIIKIDPPAMEGLTPSAMEIMPLDLVKSLDAEKVIYLNPATAQAVTSVQLSVMTPGIQRALQASLAGFFYVDNSDATTHFIDSMSVILILSSLIFFRLQFDV